MALHAFVEGLIDDNPYPDRASDPADQPAIERLLAAAGGDEYRMAALLVSADANVLAEELPEGVLDLRSKKRL